LSWSSAIVAIPAGLPLPLQLNIAAGLSRPMEASQPLPGSPSLSNPDVACHP